MNCTQLKLLLETIMLMPLEKIHVKLCIFPSVKKIYRVSFSQFISLIYMTINQYVYMFETALDLTPQPLQEA